VAIHHAGILQDFIHEIEHLERYYEAKVQAISSSSVNLQHPAVHFGLKSGACASIDDSNSIASALHPTGGMKHQWVPPSSVCKDNGDSHISVIGICKLQPVGHRNKLLTTPQSCHHWPHLLLLSPCGNKIIPPLGSICHRTIGLTGPR
jgi:hypothetical protein